MTEKEIEIIKRVYDSMYNGIRTTKSTTAKTWLKNKGLSIELTHACFNSGQFHHRKPDDFIKDLHSVGFLIESNKGTNTGKKGYSSFGREAIVFPLRSVKDEIINFCAIRIRLEREGISYLNNHGIYPAYPSSLTKTLYLTNTILDAATLLESKLMDNKEAVMALQDGILLRKHIEAINELKQLETIIFIK